MKPILEIQNISKKFTLSHKSAQYLSMRDKISSLFTRDKKEEFWALKDVSFKVEPGESIGIIGRNGAGKSTLLKILSRITPPTSGKITCRGRMASLLEVGTGFHQELTGRENIFMNGSVLGMKRSEIRNKFDEIVAFSETEKFLDTQLKYYSSGMQLRLAFAVAAHLEPDILIIDEVLAVGDAEFQKKCLRKMEDVKGAGRTILFVSHNMNTIEQLCRKAVLLNQGKIEMWDSVTPTIHKYLYQDSETETRFQWKNNSNEFMNDYFDALAFEVMQDDLPDGTDLFTNNKPVRVSIDVNVKTNNSLLNIGFALYNEDGVLLFWSFIKDNSDEGREELAIAKYRFESSLPARFLNEGQYNIQLIAAIHYKYWILSPESDSPRLFFTIRGGLSDSSYFVEKRQGLLALVEEWKIIKNNVV